MNVKRMSFEMSAIYGCVPARVNFDGMMEDSTALALAAGTLPCVENKWDHEIARCEYWRSMKKSEHIHFLLQKIGRIRSGRLNVESQF